MAADLNHSIDEDKRPRGAGNRDQTTGRKIGRPNICGELVIVRTGGGDGMFVGDSLATRDASSFGGSSGERDKKRLAIVTRDTSSWIWGQRWREREDQVGESEK